ncbi:hypothetical protein L9F63_025952, partial [Diploptera punctata]
MSKENFKNESKSITAKCMYTNTEPSHEVIVLDDLKKRGFRVTKFALGLDLKHCLLVMRTVAHYHASTVKRIKHYGGLSQFLDTCIKNLVEEINNWPRFEKYADILKKLRPISMNRLTEAVRREDAGLNVLIHGDLWLGNMMFRYSQEIGDLQDI